MSSIYGTYIEETTTRWTLDEKCSLEFAKNISDNLKKQAGKVVKKITVSKNTIDIEYDSNNDSSRKTIIDIIKSTHKDISKKYRDKDFSWEIKVEQENSMYVIVDCMKKYEDEES